MKSAVKNLHWLSTLTSADCYKYAIIDNYGSVYEPDDIFYTASAAEREGREAINTVSN
ncbi:MAG: hypothetical protein QNJ53_25890 [Pleurocapsa sp. MO_192.B19]|nr:hypothetical protein [Pleurocapsa sp. MO_192.B19]